MRRLPLSFALLLVARAAAAQDAPARLRRVVEAPHPAPNVAPVAVELSLDVDDAGRVTAARVTRSAGPAWDEAALAAARDFVFEPARRDGRTVASTVAHRYVFAGRGDAVSDEDAPRAAPNAATEQQATVRARSPSRETFRREVVVEDLRRMPGARGDALLAVQNLPGVGRTAFGQGAFPVRGSDPEDSIVTLESHPIALPFHLYGLATTVATDLVERIEFMPGNFSARWGRAAGGVVNVTLRAPARDRPRVSADVDVIDAGVAASVPIGRRVTVSAGLRRSYIDGLFALFAPDAAGASFTSLPRYWDWQLAVDADLGPRDQVRVLGAGSDDSLGLVIPSPSPEYPAATVSYGSSLAYHGAQARWRHRFAPGVEHTLSPALSFTASSVALGPDVRYEISTVTGSFRDELDARLSARARLYVGLDVQAGRSTTAITAPPLSANGIDDAPVRSRLVRDEATRDFVNPAAYAELALDPTPSLHLLAGVRVDGFSRRWEWSVDPRATARWQVHPRVALRAGFGQYTTTPRGYAVLPNFGNPSLRLERWLHATAGAQAWVVEGAFEVTVDGFAKWADGVAAPSSAVVDGAPERFANTGSARVYGAEVLARVRPGRLPLFAWLAYTVQRAERRDVASGPWYASEWDQTHLVTAMLGAVLPHGWEVGVRARYTTGTPTPNVTGGLYDSDHDTTYTYVAVDAPTRLPDFFAMDARVAKRFRWGPVALQAVLEVLNVTNHVNVESRVYSFDRRSSIPVQGLPILPSVGLRGEY
ncbi:MAG: TonB-dependent receptor [Polyangiales bacterium]